MKGEIAMKTGQTPTSRTSPEASLIVPQSEAYHLERYAAAYAQFDAEMTVQFQELELRFSQYLTPMAKRENLGRR